MAKHKRKQPNKFPVQLGGHRRTFSCPSDTVLPFGLEKLKSFVRIRALNHDKGLPPSQTELDLYEKHPAVIQNALLKLGLFQRHELGMPRLSEAILIKRADMVRIGLDAGTLRSFKTKTNPLREFFADDPPLDRITPAQAKSCRDWCEKSRVNSRNGNVGHEPTTMSKNVQVWKQLFEYFVELGVLSRNPFAKVKCGGCVGTEKRRRLIREKDYVNVLSAVEHPEARLVLSFAYRNGLRIMSELEKLRWVDLGLGEQGEGRNGGGLYFRIHAETKTGERFPPYWEETRRLAEELKESRGTVELTDLVFRTIRTTGAARYHMDLAYKRAGVEFPPKIFINYRSTCISHWKSKIPPELMDRWFGNSEKTCAAHYDQHDPKELSRQANEAILLAEGKLEKVAAQNTTSDETTVDWGSFWGQIDLANDEAFFLEMASENRRVGKQLLEVLRGTLEMSMRNYHRLKTGVSRGVVALKERAEDARIALLHHKKDYRKLRQMLKNTDSLMSEELTPTGIEPVSRP